MQVVAWSWLRSALCHLPLKWQWQALCCGQHCGLCAQRNSGPRRLNTLS